MYFLDSLTVSAMSSFSCLPVGRWDSTKLCKPACRQAGTHQAENPLGFSEVGENKQLLIANVVLSLFFIKFHINYF
jgi:hypothetical protein